MKGGITSGVVYPLAACELAEAYFFKNIGGNSAGAIAAAAVAAAEYRRRNGSVEGFAEVEQLPVWLGAEGNLFHLFQPSCETKSVFDALCAALQGKSKMARVRRVAKCACRHFWDWALLGATPGLLLALSCLAWGQGFLLIYGLVCAGVLMVICGMACAAAALLWTALETIPGNFFGICRGSAGRSPTSPEPLTDWLTSYLNRVAGKDHGADPLTFGELWNAPGKLDQNDPKERCINLEVMTTNLTHGRPYRIPFETEAFFYDPEEFAQLFPQTVVEWMNKRAEERQPKDDEQEKQWKQQLPLRPLPEAKDLPIVAAVRMSLSFPVLLSAVPLYAVDWSRTQNQEAKKSDAEDDPPPRLERCWFSDGGICSNFPVHFFDQLLPRWPTFALNLRPFHPDHPPNPDEETCENVWLPGGNMSGILEWWNRFEGGPQHSRIFSFLGAILNTMQNWVDNTQIKMPGYRDRVAHICHTDEEGGMNLNMPKDTIRKLTERGRCAGQKLRKCFAEAAPAENSWGNHRWVRYRSTMALLEETLRGFLHSYRNPVGTDQPYAQLIIRSKTQPPKSYRWERAAQQDFASKLTSDLVQFVEGWEKANEKFIEGAPNPKPELRIRPRV
jgi:predicted acylesterase/phospholipase RssA